MRRFALAPRTQWRQRQPLLSGLQRNFGGRLGQRRGSRRGARARFVGGLSPAPAMSGRRHLFTQSVVRRKDPVVTREVDAPVSSTEVVYSQSGYLGAKGRVSK